MADGEGSCSRCSDGQWDEEVPSQPRGGFLNSLADRRMDRPSAGRCLLPIAEVWLGHLKDLDLTEEWHHGGPGLKTQIQPLEPQMSLPVFQSLASALREGGQQWSQCRSIIPIFGLRVCVILGVS